MKNIFKSLLALLCCGIAMVSCQEEVLSDVKIETDLAAISDVSAQNPADVSIAVMSNTSWIVTYPKWVSTSANYGHGDAILTFSFERNYKDETTNTAARSGEIKISGGGTLTGKGVTVTIPVSQLGHTYIDPNPSLGGIPDVEEFAEFIKAANSGGPLTRWTNENGEVALLADINLGGIKIDWQAIADATDVGNANNLCTINEGCIPFSGIFNGNNHKISGFNPTVELGSNKTFGLFAVINEATIKNVELEGTMTITATGQADAGMLVGTALNSTVSDVKVGGKIISAGTTVAKRFALGGVCGYAGAKEEKGTLIKNAISNVNVEFVGGANTANGATCAMYGGIVGFSTTPNSATGHLFVTIENCENNGDMNVTLGRCSGIVATANAGTIIKDCTNNGNQVNKIANGRLGNIVCNVSNHCKVINCVNKGNLEATADGYNGTVGGILALIGSDSACVEGGANYGTIITLSTAGKYIGLLGANFNKFSHVRDLIASGGIIVDGVARDIHESNYMEHVGSISSAYADKVTNITWSGAPAPEKPEVKAGINTANDLVAFMTAVNAGQSIAQWQDADGVVNLWADLDMSGVANWTPIGNGTFNGTAVTGAAFSGVFNGNGFSIKNLTIKMEPAVDNAAAGLFGIVDNGTVKNVTVGEGSSYKVKGSDAVALCSVGGVVGALVGKSLVEACVNRATIHVEQPVVKTYAEGGVVGHAYSAGEDVLIRNCENYGKLTSVSASNNNGWNGLQIGGILGAANAASNDKYYVTVQDSKNFGEIDAEAARVGGIAGVLNKAGAVSGCVNNGNLSNSNVLANSRNGGIVGLMQNISKIENSTNNGKVVFDVEGNTTHGYVAGIVGQTGHNSDLIDGCENNGIILSDIIKGEANAKFITAIVANSNNKTITIRNCRVGGKIGPYKEDATFKTIEVTADNFADYIWFDNKSEANNPNLENNVFASK